MRQASTAVTQYLEHYFVVLIKNMKERGKVIIKGILCMLTLFTTYDLAESSANYFNLQVSLV